MFTGTCRHPPRPDEDVRLPRVGVACSCKLRTVGSGNLPGWQEQQRELYCKRLRKPFKNCSESQGINELISLFYDL